ncbi:MAG: hypothetical protein M4579_007276 [Chaenotheca gracillima]|nr:MAG: hypothetical protein M4579_007276 [Chaenotheca gracillima]
MFATSLALLAFGVQTALTQVGVDKPLAQDCGPKSGNVVCIDKYASVMPYPFFRKPSSDGVYQDTFGSTTVPNDTSFAKVADADFLVFDEKRGLDLLGSNPSYEYVFNVSMAVHEAPVWVPTQNKLYMSQLAPPPGYLPQLVIDLNQSPPSLSEFLPDPPIYAPNGGTIHNGLVYFGVSGGNKSIGGMESRPGIATFDPATNKTKTLLNNYFGYYFNTIDDVAVDSNGIIWFTDPWYSWWNKLVDTPPQIETASYRFDPSTGAVNVVDDSIIQPNGIAIAPDEKTMYISDTGAVAGLIDPTIESQGSTFNTTDKRTIYAFDIMDGGRWLGNKRPIYFSQDWVPDGLKVARNGYVVTGSGNGVDILDNYGTLLARVQTNYTVQNFAWTGPEYKTLWMMGQGGISKVEWNLQGQELK